MRRGWRAGGPRLVATLADQDLQQLGPQLVAHKIIKNSDRLATCSQLGDEHGAHGRRLPVARDELADACQRAVLPRAALSARRRQAVP